MLKLGLHIFYYWRINIVQKKCLKTSFIWSYPLTIEICVVIYKDIGKRNAFEGAFKVEL